MRAFIAAEWRTTIIRPLTILAALLFAALAAAAPAQAWTYTLLHSFCVKDFCVDGHGPEAPPYLAPDGALYGTTYYGGIAGNGIAYQRDASGHFKVLHDFCEQNDFPCLDGKSPYSTPILDTAGQVYGTTPFGGRKSGGVIFRIAPADHDDFQLLHTFCDKTGQCPDGGAPLAQLIYQGAASGALYDGVSPLYGVTQSTVYELKPSPHRARWNVKTLYAFCALDGCADGQQPGASLAMDAAGHLFGTTLYGGASDEGVIFGLSRSGGQWNYTVLYNFCSQPDCTDGAEPAAPLMMDGSGNWYGSAQHGGVNNGGVLYKLTHSGGSWQYSLLYDFCPNGDCTNGKWPLGPLAIDGDGNIIGAAYHGGSGDLGFDGAGTIYAFGNGAVQVLYSFCPKGRCGDGEFPLGVARDSNGNLFGAAFGGGGHHAGALFELSP